MNLLPPSYSLLCFLGMFYFAQLNQSMQVFLRYFQVHGTAQDKSAIKCFEQFCSNSKSTIALPERVVLFNANLTIRWRHLYHKCYKIDFWSLLRSLDLYSTIRTRLHPAAHVRTVRSALGRTFDQKLSKKQVWLKLLRIVQFVEKCNKKFLGCNHTRTVQGRTSALCGKNVEVWCLTFIKMSQAEKLNLWPTDQIFRVFTL